MANISPLHSMKECLVAVARSKKILNENSALNKMKP